tara:strand:- start:40 stop:396 length:357 start_codon:yes stop_codon:yes gene_type:complete
MIKEGEHGSICLYYKGLLISSFPISKKKTENYYLDMGEQLIRNSKCIPIAERIKYSLTFMNQMYSRKKKKQAIYAEDHQLFCASLLAMMRIGIIDNDIDNGYYIFPKKKKSKNTLKSM